MTRPTQPAAGGETIPPAEAAQIQEIIGILREIQDHKERAERPVPRNVHPKQHGCVRAELTVDSDLSAELQHGIFAEPRTYAAVVRFSNSRQKDDDLPDGHGMAIKLLDVPGEKLLELDREAPTQDFVLIDHPCFFARNVADMIPLMHDFRRLMIGGLLEKGGTVARAALSSDYRYRLLRKTASKRPDNPLEVQYWSTTPYRLGDGAMKFSLRPQLNALPAHPIRSPDKLRLAMVAQLQQKEARFDFLVQRQTDPGTMPIEDATAMWNEVESPYRRVATLRIPPQTFDLPEVRRFGENLSFTPWHALPAHQPLGGINRARKAIYEEMSARRRTLNDAPRREPTLSEVQALWPPHTRAE